ncbi:MAG: hypothetical protein QXU40_01480, partial [Candidatus Pacearchaeota archaeon]
YIVQNHILPILNHQKKRCTMNKYSITYSCNCSCKFNWEVESGYLSDNHEKKGCWEKNTVRINNKVVAEYYRNYGWVVSHGLIDDIPEEIQNRCILKEESGYNDMHMDRAYESLVQFLMRGEYELRKEISDSKEYILTLKASSNEVSLEDAKKWAELYIYPPYREFKLLE